MASCEKCWGDAYMRWHDNPMKDQAEHYHDLLKERKDNQCTPEQQAGRDAEKCPKCNRIAIHEICNVCMNCGYRVLK